MTHEDDRNTPRRDRDDLPGPTGGTDTGTGGNADERSSENRREGLRKDRERSEDEDAFERGER